MAEITRGNDRNNPLYTHITSAEGVNWAKDSTLNDLVSKADINNTILRELAKQTVPDLEKKLEAAESKSAKRLGDQLEAATRQTGKDTANAIKEDTDEFKRYARDTKTLWQSKLDSLGHLLTSADPNKFISQFGPAFEKRGGEIGQKLGEALGRSKLAGIIGSIVGTAAASAITAALSRSLEISKTFTDLYDTGITFNGSMTQMTETAVNTRQTLEQMQTSMSKFSSTAATVGSTRLAEFGKTLLNATRQGAEYAVTQDQMREIAYSYMEMQIVSGSNLAKTQAQLNQGAQTYVKDLTEMSILTGKSRKELAEQQKAQMARAQTRAAQELLRREDPKAAERLEKLLVGRTAEQADMIRAMFMEAKGKGMTYSPDQLKARFGAFQQEDLQKLMQDMTDNTKDISDVSADLADTFDIRKMSEVFLRGAAGQIGAGALAGAGTAATDLTTSFTGLQSIIQEGINKGLTPTQALQTWIDKSKPTEATKVLLETQSDIIQSLSTVKSEIDDKMLKGVQHAAEYMEQFGTKLNELLSKMGMPTGMSGVETGLTAATVAGGIGLTGASALALKGGKAVVEKGAEAVSKSRIGDIARAVTGTALKATAGIEATLPEAEAVVAESTGLLSKLTKLKGGLVGATAGLALDYGGEMLSSAGYARSGALAQIMGETATAAGTGAMAAGVAGSIIPGLGTVVGAGGGGLLGGAYGLAHGLYEHGGELIYGKETGAKPTEEKPTETTPSVEPTKPEIITPSVPPVPIIQPTAPGVNKDEAATVEARNRENESRDSMQIAEETRAAEMANRGIMEVSNKKATEFYDRYNLTSDSMVVLLKDIADKLDRLNQNVVDQTSDLDRSISSISGTLI